MHQVVASYLSMSLITVELVHSEAQMLDVAKELMKRLASL